MGVQIELPSQVPIFIINVYLPSTNITMDVYREHIGYLQTLTDWLSERGILIICGDLNGQLGPMYSTRAGVFQNARGTHISQFLDNNNMYSTISHINCMGPVATCFPIDPCYRPSQIDHYNQSRCVSSC